MCVSVIRREGGTQNQAVVEINRSVSSLIKL